MVEFNLNISIPIEQISGASAEDAERIVKDKVLSEINKVLDDKIDDVAVLDINPDANGFNIKTSMVMCSSKSLATSFEMMAQIMAEKGLDAESIENILSLITQDSGGW